jgi:hypothetical protein
LELGVWPSDTAGGWIAAIANPTKYSGSIIDARLVFQRPKPNLPVAITLSYAPKNWQPASMCGGSDPPIPPISLAPEATTQFRLVEYARELRATNQRFMAAMDKEIPERMKINCIVQVDVVAGNGKRKTLSSGFACSRLPYPSCR